VVFLTPDPTSSGECIALTQAIQLSRTTRSHPVIVATTHHNCDLRPRRVELLNGIAGTNAPQPADPATLTRSTKMQCHRM
jgi:hypothetical protein